MQIAFHEFMEKVQAAIGYSRRAGGLLITTEGGFIYRGEPECYPEVSSSLWRKYEECHYYKAHHSYDDFDMESLQKELINAAKEHIPTLANNRVTIPVSSVETDHKSRVTVAQSASVTWNMLEEQRDLEILTDIQHYGGETNLIDFTHDYLIALFFACDGSFDEDGRIITLDAKNNKVKQCLKEPSNPQNRIIAQKSIFVEPSKGFIEKNLSPKMSIVPKEDKHYILKGLEIFHNISAKTIYNDLHGFITHQKAHQEPCGVHDAFHRGLNHHLKAEKKKKKKKKNKHYDKALMFYDQALAYNSTYHQARNKKGFIHLKRDELDEAKQCFERALSYSHNTKPPEKVIAESYRGLGRVEDGKGALDGAIFNYNVAIEKHPKYYEAYMDRSAAYFKKGDQENALTDWLEVQSFRCYPDFEKQYGVKLPGRRKIRAFTIFGRRIWVKTWREMAEWACYWFIFYVGQVQPDIEERVLSYPRFSERPENFRAGQHMHVWNTNLYVETYGDSRTLQKFVTRLITDFGYHEDSITFEIFVDEVIEECS